MSIDASHESRHLAGTATAEKQCSQGDTRVWFFFVLTRGLVGVHTFDALDFPGETMQGAAKCVEVLPRMLDKMLGRDASKPRILFSDRGPGFYNRSYGTVTGDYEGACKSNGFQLWAGTKAAQGPHAQPGDIADMLLHETVTSWLRARLAKSGAALAKAWEETLKELAKRIEKDVRDLNRICDVKGLCMEFPERLRALKEDTHGDRLRK